MEENNAKLIILVGGYPKGYGEPFSANTHSGRVLRRMVEQNNLRVFLLDLWSSQEEEKRGDIKKSIKEIIRRKRKKAHVIALGKWVHKCMISHGINCEYLPHPASRRRSDVERLEKGLLAICE